MKTGGIEDNSFPSADLRTIETSFFRAVPHFIPLLLFPLLAAAAWNGGWWLVGPYAFLIANYLDPVFGQEKRNVDLQNASEAKLFWYKLSVWMWAALWPPILLFALWRILVSGELALWEQTVLVMELASIAPLVFVISHELIHRRDTVERWIGDFLMASVSWPHCTIEHIYIHHAKVGTPQDSGSAPRGLGFWKSVATGLPRSLAECWRFEINRLARSNRPRYHIRNVFWRYLALMVAWYGLAWWMGTWVGVLVMLAIGMWLVMYTRLVEYIQHYGLRRIRTRNGRYERLQPHHAWTAGYRLTNWLFLNTQRHPDHHMTPRRRYPMLQHHDEDQSPQLPYPYIKMMSLALSPKRWFEVMDPLVDQYRARFYPEIDDWRAYDSEAYAARPEAQDIIAEILFRSPRLAGWINRMPKLLDSLETREFTILDLPAGFGPDPENENLARRGLARVYWTLELGLNEMKGQLTEIPAQNAKEAAEAAREWANNKLFQIALHSIRTNLSPAEAGAAVQRVADASVSMIFTAACEDVADRHPPHPGNGIGVVAFGGLATGGRILGTEFDLRLFCEGTGTRHHSLVEHRFRKALQIFARDNLLFDHTSNFPDNAYPLRLIPDHFAHLPDSASREGLRELLDARLVCAMGDVDVAESFEMARRDALAQDQVRQSLMSLLERDIGGDVVEPGPETIHDMIGGKMDVERVARFLQVKYISDAPDILGTPPTAVFEVAGARGWVPAETARRLNSAASLWRDLDAIVNLAAIGQFKSGEASDEVKDFVAKAAGLESFGELNGHIRETALLATAEMGKIK